MIKNHCLLNAPKITFKLYEHPPALNRVNSSDVVCFTFSYLRQSFPCSKLADYSSLTRNLDYLLENSKCDIWTKCENDFQLKILIN